MRCYVLMSAELELARVKLLIRELARAYREKDMGRVESIIDALAKLLRIDL